VRVPLSQWIEAREALADLMFVVPKGIEHRPVARGEVHILLERARLCWSRSDAAGVRTNCEYRE
jgi:hypothetical protein